MRRSENLILLTCLLCTLISCKTVPAVPVVEQGQQVIERETITIKESAVDLSGIVTEIEKAGTVNAEQIASLKTKTSTLVLQTESLLQIVKAQSANIAIMQDQQEKEKIKLYDIQAKDAAEIKALTEERDRAIDKYDPWKKTALTLIFIISVLLLLTIIRIVLKYFLKT